MRSQKCGFAVILTLAVSLLAFSVYGYQARQTTPDQAKVQALLDQMKVSKNVSGDAKESFAKQIAADFKAMKILFETKDFCSLAKLLDKRGASLATPGFEKIYGSESAEFWESVWKEGAELELVPVHIYVTDVKKPQLVPFSAVVDQGITIEEWKKNPSYYDAVAVLIFEYHIVDKAKGETSQKSADPPAAEIYFHKTVCHSE